ncbi:hypothetical protein [Paraburkholderia phosphatilytica]|uniref:hypothetical protein n=1 Tax=Paraburkholderia phosphatilytica TaxID=2282883 RepID=UPI000E4816BF|nr:hypothetical protein [Paraburkholderia phosphatilytica]
MLGKKPHLIPFLISLGCLSGLLAIWVSLYGPSWPYRDSFVYFLLLDLFRDGKMTLLSFIPIRNNEHLVAFHYAFGVAILLLSGFKIKAFIVFNAVLLAVTVVYLYVTTQSSGRDRIAGAILPFVIAIGLSNAAQASYLLWEFQIWLYIDLALLAINCFLIERYALRAYPVVFVLCVLATGSEAQGAFLWVASAIHIFCAVNLGADTSKKRAGTAIIVLHVVLFLAAAWLITRVTHDHPAVVQPAHGVIPRVMQRVTYLIQLLGSGFGVRSEKFALWAGLVSLLCWMVGTVYAARARFATSVSRVALVLTSTALLWAGAFSVGRADLGIDWALSQFHAAPMLMPFFVGLGLYGVGLLDRRKPAFALVLLVVGIAPTFTSIPLGYVRSADIKKDSMIAVAAECAGGSDFLKRHVDGLESHPILFDAFQKYQPRLCAQMSHLERDKKVAAMPDEWERLAAGDDHHRKALSTLWDEYLVRGDLQDAFPAKSPTRAQDLLKWAASDAAHGSGFNHELLGPYAADYIELAKKL